MASCVPGSYLGRSFAGLVRECAPPTVLLDGRVARAVLRRPDLLDPPDLLGRDGEVMRRIIDLQADISQHLSSSDPDREELLDRDC